MLTRLVSKKWILPSLLVPLAMGVMVRLGIWQLDRLEGRREHNQHVRSMRAMEPLDMNQGLRSSAVSAADLAGMEYRDVTVSGEYLHDQEMVIRNQAWDHQPGVHLLTPLKIDGTDQAVLVDRGWIPLESFQDGRWKSFTQSGRVKVNGMIRIAPSESSFGGRPNPTPPGGKTVKAWNFVDIEAIEGQTGLSLLPVYIQGAPAGENDHLPYRGQPEFELTQGPHLGYAIQWFMFAAILGLGYPVYVHRQEDS